MHDELQPSVTLRPTEPASCKVETSFRDIFHSSPDAIFVEDLRGFVLAANPAAYRLHEAEPGTLIGCHASELVPPTHRASVQDNFRRLVAGHVDHLEAESWTMSGRAVPVEIRAEQFAYRGQPAVLLFVRDITERRELERRIVRSRELERRRLGRELHDTLPPLCSGIALMARGLLNRLQQGKAADLDILEEIIHQAREGVKQARALSHGLNPVSLKERSLQAALREMCAFIEQTSGIPCAFMIDPVLRDLKEPAHQLYRIAQEAVHNAARHAHADHIWVRLRDYNGSIVLTVEDDGRGIQGCPEETDGMGLHTMTYRARLIGGVLRVVDRPEGGTCVCCIIPLHPASSGEPGQAFSAEYGAEVCCPREGDAASLHTRASVE